MYNILFEKDKSDVKRYYKKINNVSEKLGFTSSKKSRFKSLLVYLFFILATGALALLAIKEIINDKILWIPGAALVLFFFLYYMRFEIRKKIYVRTIKKNAVSGNLPNGVKIKVVVAENVKTRNFEVWLCAYSEGAGAKNNYLMLDKSLYTIARNRYGDLIYNKDNYLRNTGSLSLKDFLIVINTDDKKEKINYKEEEIEYRIKRKQVRGRKNWLSTVLYSVTFKIVTFVAIFAILCFFLEFFNGLVVSTVAVFGLEKVFTVLMNSFGVKISVQGGQVDSYINIYFNGNEDKQYRVNLKENKYLKENFPYSERE